MKQDAEQLRSKNQICGAFHDQFDGFCGALLPFPDLIRSDSFLTLADHFYEIASVKNQQNYDACYLEFHCSVLLFRIRIHFIFFFSAFAYSAHSQFKTCVP